ncbi:MAG TPA: hypothetical protein VES67_02810 [Vicinamibacterales bacterium]|nr:hypothetical protein [Vicinamibacterales bacterium]
MSGAVLKSGHREATLDRRVSFAGLQSGRYVLRVEVWDATGERTHREIPIEVK